MHPVGVPRGDAHVPVDTDRIVGSSKLLGEMRDHIRRRLYSIRTEQAYLNWAKRYILFHGKRHPSEMGGAEIVAFLNHLATCFRHDPPRSTRARAKLGVITSASPRSSAPSRRP